MSYEHRALGDAATAGAVVNVGGEAVDERFLLSFGDVVALSGDYFRPAGGEGHLFELARVPGGAGPQLGTRDELVCALKVAVVDEDAADPRFEPGGPFAHVAYGVGAGQNDVERRVRDRYLTLAANNDDHFVAPGPSDAPTGSGYGSAPVAYHHLHRAALDLAFELGRDRGDVGRAMAREAAAQHYLTDAFAAGHLRTPVAAIRRYWKARYPAFWAQLQRRVAAATAGALREVAAAVRLLPAGYVHRRTLDEVTNRTRGYPQLSVGDLVARALHDWDNRQGVDVEGGGRVFGDGRVGEGDTEALALAAVRAGNADVEAAFALGRSGRARAGGELYAAVAEATGAAGDALRPEAMVPRPTPANPGQNWSAPDAETLWHSPLVGSSGATVGQAIEAMLEPGGQFARQLEGLGTGLAGTHGVFALPVLGAWLRDRCCHAFHRGFVEPLTADPHAVVADLVRAADASSCIEPPWR